MAMWDRREGKRLGRPPGSKNRNRRDELLRRLKVDVKFLESQPQISPLLKQSGILPARVIEVLRGDENGESQNLVALWDALTPANQKILGLEALSVAAGLTPRRLWELYNGASLMQWLAKTRSSALDPASGGSHFPGELEYSKLPPKFKK
jgi:hypothetical protein